MSMKKINKASIAVAVASALAASSAQAVNIAEDGLGEYIYSPYYTARNGFETYINVQNTSDETVIFKIRFREAVNSRDVRDFNVVLSPYDVWTAAVTANESGNAARLVTHDNSCTVPESIRSNGIDFTNAQYVGSSYDDWGPTDLERTMEGYFEIIAMGSDSALSDGAGDSENPPVGNKNDSTVAVNAVHVLHKEGTYAGQRAPVDCGKVDLAFLNVSTVKNEFDEPKNALKVNAAIINVNDGLGFAIPVTTLANFVNPDGVTNFRDGMSTEDIMAVPSKAAPNAGDAKPAIAEVTTNAAMDNDVTAMFVTPAPNAWVGRDAVTAVLMRNSVINQFRVEEGQADTDWVVTFPTKNLHIDDVAGATYGVQRPFIDWAPVPGLPGLYTVKPCVEVGYHLWDREEDATTVGVVPSPEIDTQQICDEVNVIQFGEGVLGARSPTLINPEFDKGWMRLDFGPLDGDQTGAYDLVSTGGTSTLTGTKWFDQVVFEGLPVIGFALQNLDNWSVANELVQYGFAWDHAYGRSMGVRTQTGVDSNGAPIYTYYQVGNAAGVTHGVQDAPPTLPIDGGTS